MLNAIYRILIRNQNQNSLMVQCQNDNIAPGGLGQERLVSSAYKRSKLRHTIIRNFSRGNQRIREVIPVPASCRKEDMVICVCTCEGCLKCQRVLVSAISIFLDKVICRNSGFTFQTINIRMILMPLANSVIRLMRP